MAAPASSRCLPLQAAPACCAGPRGPRRLWPDSPALWRPPQLDAQRVGVLEPRQLGPHHQRGATLQGVMRSGVDTLRMAALVKDALSLQEDSFGPAVFLLITMAPWYPC